MPKSPESFPIAIDRPAYRRHLERQARRLSFNTTTLFGFLLAMAAFVIPLPTEHRVQAVSSAEWQHALWIAGISGGTVLIIAITCGFLGYLIWGRRRARRIAEAAYAAVDGAFLHIRTDGLARTDSKAHFRNVDAYSTYCTAAMQRDLITHLHCTLSGGGLLVIPAVVNAEQVRDQLAAIDAAREHRRG
jgi:hypothetical protein